MKRLFSRIAIFFNSLKVAILSFMFMQQKNKKLYKDNTFDIIG